jgi:hypothetical protein
MPTWLCRETGLGFSFLFLFLVGGGGIFFIKHLPASPSSILAACTERTAEDQHVQGTKRQACLYPQLLQGYR